MNAETLQAALPEYFAPWVQELGLRAEAFDTDSVTLRLPQSPRLSRVGGMLCGQAMMAAADTAMVLALINHFGEFRPCTTVQMNTSFLSLCRIRTRCCRRACCGRGSRWHSAKSTCAVRRTARACAELPSPTRCCKTRMHKTAIRP